MATAITADELTVALEEASRRRNGDVGLTVQELATAAGTHVQTVRGRLRVLIGRDGVVIGRKAIQRIDGNTVTVPCYRLKKAKR